MFVFLLSYAYGQNKKDNTKTKIDKPIFSSSSFIHCYTIWLNNKKESVFASHRYHINVSSFLLSTYWLDIHDTMFHSLKTISEVTAFPPTSL